jgi:hypothetical protein
MGSGREMELLLVLGGLMVLVLAMVLVHEPVVVLGRRHGQLVLVAMVVRCMGF